jgi:hypothetical protein
VAAIRVLEYLDSSGRSPWRRWFNDLDAIAAAKVGTADGETVVILLGGSTKKRQSAAIASAHKAWDDYKRRKKGAA